MQLEHPDAVLSVVTLPGLLCTGCQDAKIRIFDAHSFRCLLTLTDHSRAVLALRTLQYQSKEEDLSPSTASHGNTQSSPASHGDINMLLSASGDQTVRLYQIERTVSAGTGTSQQQQRVAGSGSTICTAKCITVINGQPYGMGPCLSMTCAISPIEGETPERFILHIFAGFQNTRILLYQAVLKICQGENGTGTPTLECIASDGASVAAHTGGVYSLLLAYRENNPASANSLQQSRTICNPPMLSLSAGDWSLFSASADGKVCVWQICAASYQVSNAESSNSDSGQETISELSEYLITLEHLHLLSGHTDSVHCVTLIGNNIFTGSEDSTVSAIWSLHDLQNEMLFSTSLLFLWQIRVWDYNTATCKCVLHGHSGAILCMAQVHVKTSGESNTNEKDLESNDIYLCTGSVDGSIRIWETSTLQAVACIKHNPFSDHETIVMSLATSARWRAMSVAGESALLYAMRSEFPKDFGSKPLLLSAGSDHVLRLLKLSPYILSGGIKSSSQSATNASQPVHGDSRSLFSGHKRDEESMQKMDDSMIYPELENFQEMTVKAVPTQSHFTVNALERSSFEKRTFKQVAGREVSETDSVKATDDRTSSPHIGPQRSSSATTPKTLDSNICGSQRYHATNEESNLFHATYDSHVPTDRQVHDQKLHRESSFKKSNMYDPTSKERENSIYPRIQVDQSSLVKHLGEFISIRSVSKSKECVNECWRAAYYVSDILDKIGADVRLVQCVENTNPVVIGRLGYRKEVPTVVIHGHYDVQPAHQSYGWKSHPFQMKGVDGYLYGRGATDNKGPLLSSIFAATQAYYGLYEQEKARNINFCFLIEGEGENGSRGFKEAVENNLRWFNANERNPTLLLNTNNVWLNDQDPCITYGMRGLTKILVEVETQKFKDIHSGTGGGCPEP